MRALSNGNGTLEAPRSNKETGAPACNRALTNLNKPLQHHRCKQLNRSLFGEAVRGMWDYLNHRVRRMHLVISLAKLHLVSSLGSYDLNGTLSLCKLVIRIGKRFGILNPAPPLPRRHIPTRHTTFGIHNLIELHHTGSKKRLATI